MSDNSPIVVVAHGGTIFGLDSSDGSVKWEHTISQVDMVDTVELAVCGESVFACTTAAASELWCIRYADGQVLGRVPLPFKRGGRARLMALPDRLVVTRHGEVACVSLQGQVVWQRVFEWRKGGTSMAVPGQAVQADLTE